MRYECQECHHIFKGSEAICKDWNDPALSFICPRCNVSLQKPYFGSVILFAKGTDVSPSSNNIMILVLLFFVLFFIPAFVFLSAPTTLSTGLFGFALLVLGISIAVAYRKVFSRPHPVKQYESM